MIIAIDFDGTVVEQPMDPCSPDEELCLRPKARAGLLALKDAGHTLVLHSARSNMALRLDWKLNPLWADGVVLFDPDRWAVERDFWEASHRRMEAFVDQQLPGVFDAVDQGMQGKPVADLYLDDRALRMGWGSWDLVAEKYGTGTVVLQ